MAVVFLVVVAVAVAVEEARARADKANEYPPSPPLYLAPPPPPPLYSPSGPENREVVGGEAKVGVRSVGSLGRDDDVNDKAEAEVNEVVLSGCVVVATVVKRLGKDSKNDENPPLGLGLGLRAGTELGPGLGLAPGLGPGLRPELRPELGPGFGLGPGPVLGIVVVTPAAEEAIVTVLSLDTSSYRLFSMS